ncbi:hypothetical protein BLA29_008165, partial [Euroglyphus maynei]
MVAKKAETVAEQKPEEQLPKKRLSVKKPAAEQPSKVAESSPVEEPKRRLSIKKPTTTATEQTTDEKEPVKRRLSIKKRSSISTPAESATSSPASTAPSSPTSKTAPSLAAPSEEGKPPSTKRLSIKKPPTQASIPENKPIAVEKKVEEEMKRKDSTKAPETSTTEPEQPKKRLSIKKKTPNGELPTTAAASKMQKVPSIEIQTAEEERPSAAKRGSVRDASARKPSLESKPKVVVEDNENSRRDSLDRRDSVIEGMSARSSRRPSIVIIADEKGLAVDETGQMKKLRPGEMLEVRRGSRRGSNVVDLRRSSSTEIDRVDKPSTPL